MTHDTDNTGHKDSIAAHDCLQITASSAVFYLHISTIGAIEHALQFRCGRHIGGLSISWSGCSAIEWMGARYNLKPAQGAQQFQAT